MKTKEVIFNLDGKTITYTPEKNDVGHFWQYKDSSWKNDIIFDKLGIGDIRKELHQHYLGLEEPDTAGIWPYSSTEEQNNKFMSLVKSLVYLYNAHGKEAVRQHCESIIHPITKCTTSTSETKDTAYIVNNTDKEFAVVIDGETIEYKLSNSKRFYTLQHSLAGNQIIFEKLGLRDRLKYKVFRACTGEERTGGNWPEADNVDDAIKFKNFVLSLIPIYRVKGQEGVQEYCEKYPAVGCPATTSTEITGCDDTSRKLFKATETEVKLFIKKSKFRF